MAESTLSVTYADLQREVIYFIGWGTSTSGLTSDQLAMVNGCINEGLRQFYAPPRLPGQSKAHRWSFLRPTKKIKTVANVGNYDLPDVFASMDGPLTYVSSHGWRAPIKIVGESQIRGMQNILRYGQPTHAAIRPKENLGTGYTGQRFELILYPIPNAEFELEFRCRINPEAMSTFNPANTYPPGGSIHGSTIVASCLAAAEEKNNGGKGPKWERFIERLVASIDADLEQAPESLGVNRDTNYRTTPCRHGSHSGLYLNGEQIL